MKVAALVLVVIFGFGISGTDQHQLCQRLVACRCHVVDEMQLLGSW